jgi:hypothetical protein
MAKLNIMRGWLPTASLSALIDRRPPEKRGSYRWVGSLLGYSVVLLRNQRPTTDLHRKAGA